MVRLFLRKCVAFLLAVSVTAVHFFVHVPSTQTVLAAFNPEINYQGRLLDAAGNAVADNTYNVQFKLHTAASGGSVVWTETHCYSTDGGASCTGSGTDSRVQVTDGLFSVMLGSVNAFTGVDFNQELYLSVNIGGTGSTPSYDGEMTPRKPLGAVPAAFVADTLDGVDSGQFFRNDIINATSTATTSLAVRQNGAGKIAEFFGTSGATVLSILSSGNVGIGTSTPEYRFQVHKDSGQTDLAVTTNTNVGSANTATLQFISDADGTANPAIIGQFNDGSLRLSGGGNIVSPDMVVTDAGNVGIGTTSPYAKLAVTNTGSGPSFVVEDSTSPDSTPFIVDASGNVGVGTTTPGTLFSVGNTTGINMTSNGGFFAKTPSNIYTPIFSILDDRGDEFSYIGAQNLVSFTVKTSPYDGNASWVGNFGKGDGIGTLALNFNAGATTAGTIGIDANNDFYLSGGSATDFNFSVGNSSNFNITTGASSNISAIAGNSSGSGNLSLLGTSATTNNRAGITTVAGDSLSLLTASTTRLIVTSSGLVGIGTTSPSHRLTVAGGNTFFENSGDTKLFLGDLNNYFQTNGDLQGFAENSMRFNADGGAVFFQNTGGAKFQVGGSSEVDSDIFLDNGGNLGIGSTTPYAKLSVGGDAAISGGLYDNNATRGTNGYVLQTTGTGINWVATSSLGISSSYGIGSAVTSGTAGSVLFVNSSGNLAQDNAAFYWDSASDELGIGVSNPTAKLDISLSGSSAGTVGLQVRGGNTTGNFGTSQIAFGYSTYDLYRHAIKTRHNNISSAENAIDFFVWDYTADAAETIGTKNVMSLLGNGNVGIGTSSPYAKLAVVGQAVAEYFTATSTTATSTIAGGLTVDTNALVVDHSTGKVGIGTTVPGTLLSVAGTSTLRDVLPSGSYTGNMSAYDMGASNARWNAMWAGTYNVGTSTWSISSTGADRFGIFNAASAGGTEAFSILSSGNVGIGTTSPYAKLSVAGQAGAEYFTMTSTTATSTIAGGLNIESGGLVYDHSSGKVGMGTESPTNKLHLYFSDSLTSGITIRNVNSGVNAGAALILGTDNSTGGGQIISNSNANTSYGGANSLSILNVQNAPIAFFTAGNLPANERMRITSTGNVGIGTTSPYAKFSVSGDTAITGGLYDNNATRGTDGYVLQTTGTGIEWVATSTLGLVGGADTQIQFNNAGTLGASADFTFATASGLVGNESGGTAADFRWESDTMSHSLFVDASLNQTFIGYSSAPSSSSAKLSVNGTINSTGMFSPTTFDYGFDLTQTSFQIYDTTSGTNANITSDIIYMVDGSDSLYLRPNYINFSSAATSTGFGVRNNAGTIEVKDSGGAWSPIATADDLNDIGTTTVAFMAHRNGVAQAMTNNTYNAINWTHEDFDTNNNFNLTDERFTPTIAGYYQVNLQVYCIATATGCYAAIYKNGSVYAISGVSSASSVIGTAANVIYMNGSTDYLTAYAYPGGGTSIYGESYYTNFTGVLVTPVSGTGGGWVNDGTQSFLVDSTHKVGIGTSTPSGKLAIAQTADTQAGGLYIAATDGDYRSIYMNTSQVMSFQGGSGNTATLNAAGAWTNASDIAYKENITEIDYGLEEIMLLNPRRYTWKSNGASDIGFIAQELEQIIPEVVFGEDGAKTVSYGQLSALTIRGLQDIGSRIDLFGAPTSTPSLKLDTDGRFIVNNDFTVQNEATIRNLTIENQATFANGLLVAGTSTSSFGGALLVEGSVTLGAGDITITSNGIESANAFAINESQFYVATSGAIGIGTTTPARMLHVVRGEEGSPVRFQDTNGYCEINPTTASLICTSDETLKENITDIASAPVLDQIRALRPVTFEWLSDDTNQERTGFIAQEVEVVMPDLVYTDAETGLKSVAYGGFVPYIVSAMQEMIGRIDELASRVDSLAEQMQALTSRGYSAATGVFQNLRVGSPEAPSGITIYDEETGDPYCFTVKNGSIVTRFGVCGTPIDQVTETHEQHVLEESIVSEGESVDPDMLLEISSSTDQMIGPELPIEEEPVTVPEAAIPTPSSEEADEPTPEPDPEPTLESAPEPVSTPDGP